MSAWKVTATTVTMVAASGLVKAHGHFVRLALLAILGLLGMYMLHKLAQDYNRITGGGNGGGGGGGGGGNRPRIISVLGMATRLLRSKRSVDSQLSQSPIEDLVSKFSSVLLLDPIGCARKLVCYSASKTVANLTQSENYLLQMFQFIGIAIAVNVCTGTKLRYSRGEYGRARLPREKQEELKIKDFSGNICYMVDKHPLISSLTKCQRSGFATHPPSARDVARSYQGGSGAKILGR